MRSLSLFKRCSTGAAREQDIGDMDGALDRAKTAIAAGPPRCWRSS
jgi:hypothetical protein